VEIDVTSTLGNIEIGATGLTEILQNVRTILTTIRTTVPLDRDFGLAATFLDRPVAIAQALATADIPEAVEACEPRVTVTRVGWVESDAMDGRLIPQVRIKVNEGVTI